MRAILIDPQTKSVSEVDYSGDYRQIYSHIQAQTFTIVRVNIEGDCVFVDDEGLLNNPRHFFQLSTYPQPISGRGLILGTDAEGESVEPVLTLDQVREMVSFPAVRFVGFEETIEAHPLGTIYRRQAKFGSLQ